MTLVEDTQLGGDSVVRGTSGNAPLPSQVQKDEGDRPPDGTQKEGPAHVLRPVRTVQPLHRLLLRLVHRRPHQLPRRHLCAGLGS